MIESLKEQLHCKIDSAMNCMEPGSVCDKLVAAVKAAIYGAKDQDALQVRAGGAWGLGGGAGHLWVSRWPPVGASQRMQRWRRWRGPCDSALLQLVVLPRPSMMMLAGMACLLPPPLSAQAELDKLPAELTTQICKNIFCVVKEAFPELKAKCAALMGGQCPPCTVTA